MGRALLIVCTVVMLTGAMASNTTHRTIRETDRQVSYAESQIVARQNAVSALNQAVARVKADWPNARQVGVLSRRAATQGGYLWATTTLSGARPGAVVVRGTGTYEVDGRTDTVVVSKTLIMTSPLDAAIVVEAPTADVTFTGNSFTINGQNTTPPSASGPADAVLNKWGIKASNGALAGAFGSALGSGKLPRVRGVLAEDGPVSNGSIGAGNFSSPLQAIFDEARLHPDRRTITSSSVTGGTYGSASSPAIVVREGNLSITGNLRGYGILVVNGNLTVRGTMRWEGIVMAKQEASDLEFDYGGNAEVYGSMVLLQGSSSFTMPVDGRIKVRYVSSNAGLRSSVWVHPHGASATRYYAPGANGCGASPYTDFNQEFAQGQQMNFFIGVHRVLNTRGTPHNCADDQLSSEYYRHYARGHYAGSGRPYGYVQQMDQYLYRIAFEDIDEAINSGYGTNPDWDYASSGNEDQLIEVEVQCKTRTSSGVVIPGQWHKCTPEDPEANALDQAWTNFSGGGGGVSSAMTGTELQFEISGNAEVFYSSEAIARLAPLMDTIRTMAQVVTVEQRVWSNR